MADRDYNEPRQDYTSPEEDRYSRPNYETAEEYNQARRAKEEEGSGDTYHSSYSDPEYESHRYEYENTSYGNSAYSNLGGQMLDENGAPLKNYFAVQMVFAIVEILGFCCMNMGTMVLGILGLVFATQANTAYNQRRVEEFKSKSKVANILLIIGGVMMAVSILFNMFVLSATLNIFDEYGHEEIEDIITDLDDYDYYDDYDGEYTGSDEEPLVDGFEEFVFNGVAYSVPMTFEEFDQMGFLLEEDDVEEDIDGGDYEWIYFYDDKEETVGEVRVYNPDEEDRLIRDCDIVYICFYNNAAYDDEVEPLNLTFAGGLDTDTTYEEIEAYMGVPTYTYAPEDSGYARYSWYYYGDDGEYECFDVMFWDGILEEISIEVSQY